MVPRTRDRYNLLYRYRVPYSLKRSRKVTRLFAEMGQPDASPMDGMVDVEMCLATPAHDRVIADSRAALPSDTRAFRELINGVVSAESHHGATSKVNWRLFSGGLGCCEGPVTPGRTTLVEMCLREEFNYIREVKQRHSPLQRCHVVARNLTNWMCN